jgi:hypothetical protein
MTDLTRRTFVRNSAAAAAGATVIGAIATQVADADDRQVGPEPLVAYVSDPSKGEITVMRGEREVSVRDRKLARDISRAAR